MKWVGWLSSGIKFLDLYNNQVDKVDGVAKSKTFRFSNIKLFSWHFSHLSYHAIHYVLSRHNDDDDDDNGDSGRGGGGGRCGGSDV